VAACDVFPTNFAAFLAKSGAAGFSCHTATSFTLRFQGTRDRSNCATGAVRGSLRTRESALRTNLCDHDRVSRTGMLCRAAAIGAAWFVWERKAALMADVLYVVLLIAVFAVMGLALRGLERL
jgi:hypothetical protein